MIEPVTIEEYAIGAGSPCFIIAEAGVNHNGDLETAFELVNAAIDSGADAVKFQCFQARSLVTGQARKADYQLSSTKRAGNQYEMLQSLELSFEQHRKLKQYCETKGILYICTPYDHLSIDQLDEMGVAAYKIASTDTTNIPMLRYIAAKQRPIILSTGMCSLGEVEAAVKTLRQSGLQQIILLQCTAEYPAPIEEVNLKVMQTMEQAFLCPAGFSDHTEGVGAAPWAAALGACVIEKHFTLDCSMEGPDHKASIEPSDFSLLVQTIRKVERALGSGIKEITPSEYKNKAVMQKSLVAARTIQSGERLTEDMLTCKRPATGLPPSLFDRLVGKRAKHTIKEGELLPADCIDWNE